MKIQAAILNEVGKPFEIETVDLDSPRRGEVLIRMKAAGVCHSDWHLATGATAHALPVVPGHEGAGVIEAVGDGVRGLAVGDHVALNWAPNCGKCFYCRLGRPALCEAFIEPLWAGRLMDGTSRLSLGGRELYHFSGLSCFADYAVVPESCAIWMPKSVPFEVSALIGCAVTTGVGAVLYSADVERGQTVAVFGVGGVGLSIVMAAKMVGAATIIAVDQSQTKAELAIGFGATHALAAGSDVVAQIQRLTDGRGVDVAFDASGALAAQVDAYVAVRPAGKVVFVGLAGGDETLALPTAEVTRQEKQIIGSYYGSANPARAFPDFAEYYLRHKLPLERLISKRYTLEEINEAYHTMLGGETARGVIVFD